MRRLVARRAIVVGILALAGCLYLRSVWSRDTADWPVYEAFRCRGCGGPASVNPECIQQWGCRRCGRTTYRLYRHFRPATREDFGYDAEAFEAACVAAGVYGPAEQVYDTVHYAWATQAP